MRVRTVLVRFSLPVLLLVATAIDGCGGNDAKPLGTLGATCYADLRCNSQLTCVANVCVNRGPGGTAPSDGGAGVNGGAGAAGHDAAADGTAGHDAAAGHDGSADAPASDASANDVAAPTDGGADATDAPGNDGGDV